MEYYETINREWGDRVRQWSLIKLRTEKDLSQEQFAELINISISSYRNKENGNVEFRLSEMFRIARFFGRNVDDIFLDPNSTENADMFKKYI